MESAAESAAAPRARCPGTLTSPAWSSARAASLTACLNANAPNISMSPMTMNQMPIRTASVVMEAIGAEMTTIPAIRLITPKKIDQPVPIRVGVPEMPAISAARPWTTQVRPMTRPIRARLRCRCLISTSPATMNTTPAIPRQTRPCSSPRNASTTL